jgi:hypothetical protein
VVMTPQGDIAFAYLAAHRIPGAAHVGWRLFDCRKLGDSASVTTMTFSPVAVLMSRWRLTTLGPVAYRPLCARRCVGPKKTSGLTFRATVVDRQRRKQLRVDTNVN